MFNFLIENKEWLFSGLAVAIPIALVGWLTSSKNKSARQKQKSGKKSTNIQVGGDMIITNEKKNDG